MLEFRADPEQINLELITDFLDKHENAMARYSRLQRYYEGYHDILWRETQDKNKPNNKIVSNFPGYITDVNIGYFLGEPVSYTASDDDEDMLKTLQEIFDFNDEQDENLDIGKKCSIKGHAFELFFMDEAANIRFNSMGPENMFVVYSTSVIKEMLLAVRRWPDTVNEEIENIEVYDSVGVTVYRKSESGMQLVEERTHNFGDVPVVEYLNNDERQGDFEKALTIIDAYDKAQSDSCNDFEYFADAYLKIVNMSGTQESDVNAMKRDRVILVDSDGDVEWVVKDINDAAVENFKCRLQEDIHRFSKTPNLSDEKFAGNVTGIALRFKLWGLEQNASVKERKFKRGLQRRIELICNALEVKGKPYDWRKIQATFSRNIPAVLPEIVDMIQKLRGLVSRQTLISQLPFIEDPALEEARVEEEEMGRDLDMYGYGPPEVEETEEG